MKLKLLALFDENVYRHFYSKIRFTSPEYNRRKLYDTLPEPTDSERFLCGFSVSARLPSEDYA